MHFSNISTSKSALTMVCFAHFDLETRFAPQQSALFQHLKLQKWSGHVVLLAFWLQNVLRATTACTFWICQLPEMLRSWGAFNIFASTRASCHSGMQFFISHTTRYGSAPAALSSLFFDPPEPQNIVKTQCFATFLPFRAPWLIFFLLIFFLLSLSLLTLSLLWLLSPLLLHLSIDQFTLFTWAKMNSRNWWMTRRARSNRLSGCWVGTGLMPIGGAADLTHNSQQRSSGPHSKQAVLPIPLRSGPKISFPLWLAQTPSQPKLRRNDHSSSQKKIWKLWFCLASTLRLCGARPIG